jgi:alkylated DNA nucleotide flippase Atl1
MKKKTWKEKLEDSNGLPKVEPITGKMSKKWGEGTVAIPSPKEVDEIMRKVPFGKVVTINEMRGYIAKKHNATIGCPLTTGIFAWIAANASEEARMNGETVITPYWRTLKSGGYLNEKYSGGFRHQKELLESEGIEVVKIGGKYRIKDLEKHLFKLT